MLTIDAIFLIKVSFETTVTFVYLIIAKSQGLKSFVYTNFQSNRIIVQIAIIKCSGEVKTEIVFQWSGTFEIC